MWQIKIAKYVEAAGIVPGVYCTSKSDKGDQATKPWYRLGTNHHQSISADAAEHRAVCGHLVWPQDITGLEFSYCIENDENLKSLRVLFLFRLLFKTTDSLKLFLKSWPVNS